MKKILYTILGATFLFLGSNTVQAQEEVHNHGTCGMGYDPTYIERMFENRARFAGLDIHRTGNTIWVPVRFHLVADANAQGREVEKDCLDNLCTMNQHYASMNVQFYLHSTFNYINNNVIYNHTNEFTAHVLMNSYKTPGCVNIYVGNAAQDPQVLGYYFPAGDWIFAIRGTVNGTSKTLTHECGHYFTLMHPFYGWEGLMPPGNGVNAPNNTQNGAPSERVARVGGNANCATAADGFCDTEPDYNFGLYNAGCVYSGGARDFLGVPVDPEEDNFMSYFGDGCTTAFSAEQQTAILADVNSRGLQNNPAPNFLDITTPITYVTPTQNQVVPYYNSVDITWDPIPNATAYILEVWLCSQANGNPVGQSPLVRVSLTNATTYNVTNLNANTQGNNSVAYIARVYAYNNRYFCSTWQTVQFETPPTAVGIEDVNELTGVTLSPNPVGFGQNVLLNIDMVEVADLTVSMYNMAGQMVSKPQMVAGVSGSQSIPLDIRQLASGVYVVAIDSEKGSKRMRLIVE